MKKDLFVDKILETENLTDELEDPDAQYLLDWGITRLDQVLQGTDDPDAGGERVNTLMAVMRKINRILGKYSTSAPADLAEDLAALEDLFAQAFPGARAVSFAVPQREAAAARLPQLTPRQALEYLTREFHPLG